MSYRKEFINNIKDGAIEGWETHKILPSVSIAQGILESNWGRSALAKNANNLFGIKGSHKGQSYIIKTWEHINGKDITVDAAFRKYPNWDESLVDHAEFFVSTAWRANNYKNVIGETDYKKATKALSDAGYATDPNYAGKLNNIIETYNLMEYDKKGVKKMAKIYIDPGHGGHDGGASGSGLVEKQWVLEVSLELAKILRALGHSVRLSRSNDIFIGLAERSADANRWGADIFISVHFNAGGGYGWEDFIFNGTVSNNTKKLQNDIHEAIKPVLTKHGMRNRGKKTANFSVLRQTNAPAILIEGGFVDTTDNAVLKKADYKKDVATGLANGVQSYLGLKAGNPIKPGTSKPSTSKPSGQKSVSAVAKEVIAGKWGVGAERTRKLSTAGYDASAVQSEVNKQLGVSKPKPVPSKKSNTTIAKEVIAGKWGAGNDRIKKLRDAGYNSTAIQSEVNKQLGTSKKSNLEVAKEVIAGKWGTGSERTRKLNAAGYNANAVQSEVNKQLGASKKPAKKSNATIAKEVIAGKWGTGDSRINRLKKAGYNPSAVQAEVNKQLGASKKSAAQVADEIYRGRGNWGTGNTRNTRLRNAGYNPAEVQRLVNRKFK